MLVKGEGEKGAANAVHKCRRKPSGSIDFLFLLLQQCSVQCAVFRRFS